MLNKKEIIKEVIKMIKETLETVEQVIDDDKSSSGEIMVSSFTLWMLSEEILPLLKERFDGLYNIKDIEWKELQGNIREEVSKILKGDKNKKN